MCVRMGLHGVPLDDITLNDMPAGERQFWLEFLELATSELGAAEAQPAKPSEELQRRYAEALTKYNGRVYCQVKQLEGLFAFAEPNVN